MVGNTGEEHPRGSSRLLFRKKRQVRAVNTLRYTTIFFGILVLLFSAFLVVADGPAAPQMFTRGATSGFNANNFPLQQTTALAGNITVLTIEGVSQTRAWQGYYGNITGWITLDDANNFTFYNWSSVEPKGQIYASLVPDGTPSWYNVDCFNQAANGSNFNDFYDIRQSDADNVTITFNLTNHPTFYILDSAITNCPTTWIFRDDARQETRFANMLLYDPTKLFNDTDNPSTGTAGWIFGTVIENRDLNDHADFSCYNGAVCDFQIMVAEDGHGTDTATTSYYFWVDLQG